jgi:hypothetical protein
MKRVMMLVLLFAITGFAANAQASLKDVFANKETPLFYYGIDFTNIKVIDDAAINADDVVSRQFNGINDVVVNEPKKYTIADAFRKSQLAHDLSFVSDRNKTTDPKKLTTTTASDFERLSQKDIEATVAKLKTGSNSGVGLLFVAEGLSKGKKAMSVWVTFIDSKTKKVLYTERMEAKMSTAFSLRNQWASCIKNLIDDIDKKKFKEWKKKFAAE